MNVVQTGTDDLPRDLPVMQTYDRYTEAFPSETNAVAVVVEADDVRGGEVGAGIDELVAEAEASETLLDGDRGHGQRGRHGRQRRRSRRRATAPTSESMAALDEVRDELVPATVGAVDGRNGHGHRRGRSVERLQRPAR